MADVELDEPIEGPVGVTPKEEPGTQSLRRNALSSSKLMEAAGTDASTMASLEQLFRKCSRAPI